MIALAGLGSFFIGSSIQTAMPAIAGSGTAYGVLLFANGLGGVLGGLLLEGTGWLRPSIRTATWSTAVYGLTTVLFAASHAYLVAAPLLAPREKRGQVIGVGPTVGFLSALALCSCTFLITTTVLHRGTPEDRPEM